jgi:hypothetical protein
MRLNYLAPILLIASAFLHTSCGLGYVMIALPGGVVTTYSFPVTVTLTGSWIPNTLSVTLNGTDITGSFSGGPKVYTATLVPGAPLRDANTITAHAQLSNGGGAFQTRNFDYEPPGKARVVEITSDSQRITGPLGHSRIGDYVLENGLARFVVQNVGQRDLYSVGQYGGNIIDAELVGNEGVDNFLEVQPGFNVETVINADTLDVVNDGQDGTDAILRTCGPDDLLDFANPSSQVTDLGLTFPALADDKDLEIEGCTTYTLSPDTDPDDPQDYVRIDTEVFNNEPLAGPNPDPLPLIVGDWLNPAGEVETLAHSTSIAPSSTTPRANGIGPPVTTTIGALSFFGYDEAQGTDYSFVEPIDATYASFAFISGVLVVLHQDNVLLTLIGAPPSFTVAAGASKTFTRYFGVGDGDGSNAYELEQRVNGTSAGTLEGCISVAGTPVAGAKVTAGLRLLNFSDATMALSTEILGSMVSRSGACPNYSGDVRAGSVVVTAAKKGHLYPGGGLFPAGTIVTITAGATTVHNIDLAATGRLHVNVDDESASPIPARVTVVGFDPSPPLIKVGPSLPGFGGSDLGVFDDASDRQPFGLAAVGYTDASGSVEFDLEPGVGTYHVYVSRGTEYSAFRTASPITITASSTTTVNAEIARVIDTPGFVSSEFHVHGIRSADSRVSDVHRVEAYSSEGVENVVMTDHHVHTDLNPAIADAGLGSFLTATIGEEITTFDYGHFNAYPLLLDATSPTRTYTPNGLTQLSGGNTDWAKAAPVGMDFPAYGALNSTPAEIFTLATAGPLSTAATTVQINHIGSHFAPLKIDTTGVPPSDAMSDTERAVRRLPSTGAVANLYHHFPALELWNGNDRGHQSEFLDERIGIWFNLLNQGLSTTFIADTDSHRFTNLRSAGARTWTASPTDSPASIAPADVAASVDAGRAVGGQGIYVQTRLLATDGSGDVADLTLAGSTSMTDANGDVDLEITVQAPHWAEWDRIEIYANAATTPVDVLEPYLYTATPTAVLDEGDCDPTTTGDGDFDITVTADIGGVTGADRLSASLIHSFTGLTADTWFVVVVKGTDGECSPMFPVYPDDLATGSNGTLADLVDGNVGESGVMALGATNALYFEP